MVGRSHRAPPPLLCVNHFVVRGVILKSGPSDGLERAPQHSRQLAKQLGERGLAENTTHAPNANADLPVRLHTLHVPVAACKM